MSRLSVPSIESATGATAEIYRQIKQAVVGSGSAEKAQVQLMMKSLLRLEGPVAADAADALAAAVCHALRSPVRSSLRVAARLR